MKKYLFIGIGGFIGATLRYFAGMMTFPALADRLSPLLAGFPVSTLLINLSGCFVLALFLSVALELWELSPELRLGVATGFLGALTTFSTLCGEVASLVSARLFPTAFAYLAASIVLGAALIYLANVLGREVIRVKIKAGEGL